MDEDGYGMQIGNQLVSACLIAPGIEDCSVNTLRSLNRTQRRKGRCFDYFQSFSR
jgi:hypothetical protein